MNAAPFSATALFLAIVGGVVLALVAAAYRAGSALGESARTKWAWTIGTLLVVGAWLGLTAALAARGALSDFARVPPPMILLIGASFLLAVLAACSSFGKRLAVGLGVAALIGVQCFRLPVEIFLFQMEQAGIVPVQMTFAGLNFDLLTGVSALPIAWLAVRDKLPAWGALLWNLLGLGLLLNIATIALLSAPTPLRAFHNDPANTFIATWPFVWLPVFLVTGALFGHLLLFRRLWQEHQSPTARTPQVRIQ